MTLIVLLDNFASSLITGLRFQLEDGSGGLLLEDDSGLLAS